MTEIWFEMGDRTEIYSRETQARRTVQALWNLESDPLFGDRASGTQTTILLQSVDAAGIQDGDIVTAPGRPRYRILELEPTGGDGALTTLKVTHAKE